MNKENFAEDIGESYTITASLELREKERIRAKARHDEAQALYSAERNAKIGIAQNMMADSEPIEKIVRYTGLTKENIESLTA